MNKCLRKTRRRLLIFPNFRDKMFLKLSFDTQFFFFFILSPHSVIQPGKVHTIKIWINKKDTKINTHICFIYTTPVTVHCTLLTCGQTVMHIIPTNGRKLATARIRKPIQISPNVYNIIMKHLQLTKITLY